MTNVTLPKCAHWFRVQFSDFGTDNRQHMAAQVLRVTRPHLLKYDDYAVAAIDPVQIDLRDDVTDITRTEVMIQLRRQIAETARFDMTIETLDPNGKLLEQWRLRQCRVIDCVYDELSHAQGSNGLVIHLSVIAERVSVSVGDQMLSLVDCQTAN